MKEVLLATLQQKMDGCSRDQFWAVAAISGLNGLVVSQAAPLKGLAPTWLLVCAVLIAGAFAGYYLIHRHVAYYRYSADVAHLLDGEPLAPVWMKSARRPSEIATWLGTGFYVSWVAGASALGVFAIIGATP